MARQENVTGMSSHQSAKMLSDEWLTPKEITDELGPFDLDPCSPIVRPWDIAKKHFSVNDNGLLQVWTGFIWCNPPYGQQTIYWMERMAMHNDGIALIFARTETKTFFKYIWPIAKSVYFIKGRLSFYRVNGIKAEYNGGAPSVLIAYGKEADKRLSKFNFGGKYIKL
jgi:hypothetical protein